MFILNSWQMRDYIQYIMIVCSLKLALCNKNHLILLTLMVKKHSILKGGTFFLVDRYK